MVEMFYVSKKRNRKATFGVITQYAPVAIIFLAFFGLTIWSYYDATRALHNKQNENLELQMYETKEDIQTRIDSYQNILYASSGFVGTSSVVNQAKWKQFIHHFDMQKFYPGVQGVGYVAAVVPDQLPSHISSVRNAGQPDYDIYPKEVHDLYTGTVFIEPHDVYNSRVIGYNMYSESNRREALEAARDSGTTKMTNVIKPVQENDKDKQPGLIMYLPIYDQDKTPTSLQGRQANLRGFVHATFRTFDLISSNTDVDNKNVGFKITEKAGDNSLIYKTPNYDKVFAEKNVSKNIQDFDILNKTWTIEGVVSPSMLSSRESHRPATTLWAGLLFTVLVAVFIYMLILNRSRILANQEAEEVEIAKDELLALASHQLRTPATGVKQYIGMIRQGYAGKITREQRKYLDKAYASNERQLGTINEMLAVAKADAGNIKLMKWETNISDLIKDVIEEQASEIKEHHHKLIKKIPQKAIYATVDARYVRMAIDNTLSNAIKYTPKGGNITVELTATKNRFKATVSDTGVGVKKEDFKLLFEKFSRIPNELTNKVSGSGIGMYLAKKIVLAHKGSISFSSEEHAGSTCTITLPIGKIA